MEDAVTNSPAAMLPPPMAIMVLLFEHRRFVIDGDGWSGLPSWEEANRAAAILIDRF